MLPLSAVTALALAASLGACTDKPSEEPAPALTSAAATSLAASVPIAATAVETVPAVTSAAATSMPTSMPIAATAVETVTRSPVFAVPAYFAPGPLWEAMLATPGVSIAVMNPANGPGVVADPLYAGVISAARARGVRVLGYVATGHGAASTVLDDIAAFDAMYGVRDIFFDETARDCVSLAMVYAPWLTAVRSKDGFVAVNPGTMPESCWADAADLVVTFEGTPQAYGGYESPPWMRSHPAGKFWNIVYGADAGQLQALSDQANSQHVGVTYVTEDALPNPFDTLPSPWLAYLPVTSSTLPAAPGTGTVAAVVPVTAPTFVVVPAPVPTIPSPRIATLPIASLAHR